MRAVTLVEMQALSETATRLLVSLEDAACTKREPAFAQDKVCRLQEAAGAINDMDSVMKSVAWMSKLGNASDAASSTGRR